MSNILRIGLLLMSCLWLGLFFINPEHNLVWLALGLANFTWFRIEDHEHKHEA